MDALEILVRNYESKIQDLEDDIEELKKELSLMSKDLESKKRELFLIEMQNACKREIDSYNGIMKYGKHDQILNDLSVIYFEDFKDVIDKFGYDKVISYFRERFDREMINYSSEE